MLRDIDVNHTIALFLNPSVVIPVGIGLVKVSDGEAAEPLQQTYNPSIVGFQLVGDWIRVSNEFGARKDQIK